LDIWIVEIHRTGGREEVLEDETVCGEKSIMWE